MLNAQDANTQGAGRLTRKGLELMALDHHLYGNPLDIIIRREAKTCKGCAHKFVLIVMSDKLEACSKGKKKLVRCKSYKETE